MKAISLLCLLLTSSSLTLGKQENFISDEGRHANVFSWIERRGKHLEGKPWPKEFIFPLNYMGEYTVYHNTREAQYEFNYRSLVDSENNRLKVDATKKLFMKADRQVHVYDFEKKHLYVGDPGKDMCIRYELEDLSPPSLVRRQLGLNLKDILKDTWNPNGIQTQYLGKFKVSKSADSFQPRNSSGLYHVFRNRQTFVEPERDVLHSATGAWTFYYFNDKFQLVGGVTIQDMNKAQQLFTVTKMEELQEKDLKLSTGKYESEFVLVECIDYFRDEYMLLNGY